jgi:ribosomal protein S18 acetylase RimI-like enzyme
MNKVEAAHGALHKLGDGDEIPFEMLLLADETKEAIEKYIYKADIYSLHIKGHERTTAVFALLQINEPAIEIKNIAVAEAYRDLGIGSFLIDKIKQIAMERTMKEIIVGTSDCGEREIKFYQKNGFNIYGKRPNFFIENYALPIVENGCTLKDMIMLKYIL